MIKETATERLFGDGGVFTREDEEEAPDQPEEEVGQPKSRSANSFLDSLKE